ncbi:MAG: Sir2 family NAD-dependent protein deacetylase [Sphaerochaetaceae bacterium]|nr:Sir2 family NAD-dependent protein deacetylase [Sphaerochaetaceae bacterium]
MFSDSYAESKEDFEPKFQSLVKLMEGSRHMTVFTGAGVSTLSGIPDFRGKHGVYTDPWQGMDVEDIISLDFFAREPGIFYKWAKDVWYRLEDYEPNIVHKTIALLQNKSYLESVYTQNIDMLHQRAGSKQVFEIHGSPEHHHCTRCKAHYTYQEIAPKVLRDELPLCHCGGAIKPDIVFYGENLNEDILDRAWNDFSNTDLCLVLGSSLVVQPAASLPLLAKRNGADVVIVNAQPTMQDRNATLHFSDLHQTFEALSEYLLNK